MFLVTLENGEVLVEGRDVKNWNEVPVDKQILSVTLTSGFGVTRTLSGCKEYVVAYVGTRRTRQALNGLSIEQLPSQDNKQICYGKRDISRHLKSVKDISSQKKLSLKRLIRDDELSQDIKNALYHVYKDVIIREKQLIKDILDREYEYISIDISNGFVSNKLIDIDKTYFKDGVIDGTSVPNEQLIEQKLLS